MQEEQILVSALVSVYNSSQFIKGCLEDLTGQTLFKKGQLEIILIDACSQEDEYSIIKDYLSDKVIYTRLSKQTTVYGAWNEGIRLARGKYLTNANTDDRHREDALEIMAHVLESMSDMVLVYADVFITDRANETFGEASKKDRYYWYDWDRDLLLQRGCFIGPQPMWRKAIHDEFGPFDESLVVSGDAEFWLRISQRYPFYHIKEPLGLYLKSDSSIEHRNKHRRDLENLKIITMYREAHQRGEIIRVRPQRGIMEFDKDLITIIAIYSNQENLDAMTEMISAYTKFRYEIIGVNSESGSVGSLLNLALSKAKGQYVAIIDDSIIITDNTLDYLIRHLSDNIKIAFPISQQRLNYSPLPYSDLQELRQFAINFRERNLYRRLLSRGINIPCLLMSVDVFSMLGPFDERFQTIKGVLDDLSIRATVAQCDIVLCADVFVHSSKNLVMSKDDRTLFESKWGNIKASSKEGKRLLSVDTCDKAMELFLRGFLDKAIKQLLEYLAIIPDDMNAKRTMITILYYSGRYEDVISIASNIDGSEDIRLYEALSHIATERLKEATSLTIRCIQKEPIRQAIIGTLEMNKGNYDEAKRLLLQCLQQQPDFAYALKQLGYIQYSQGLKKTGFMNIERAFIVEPQNIRIAEAYHFVISIEGLYDRAEIIYKETNSIYPHCKHIQSLLIDTLLKQHKYEELMDEIEKMMLLFSIDEETLHMALTVREKIGPINNTDNNLSVCMIVKDEEENIFTALRSVKPICREIIVVDTGSSDRTKLLAQIGGAKVFDYPWRNDFAEARNFSISKATGDWILIIDADEVISPSDFDVIKGLLDDKLTAYQVITRNYTFNTSILGFIQNDGSYKEEKGLGWMPTIKIRLFPRHDFIRFQGNVHELVEDSIKQAGLVIKTAPFVIHHYGKLDYEKDRKKGEYYYDLGLKKLRANANDPKALKELAIVAGALGKVDEGIDLWKRYLSIEKDNLDALLNLLGLYTFKGDKEKIIDTANQIIHIDPQNKIALQSLNKI